VEHSAFPYLFLDATYVKAHDGASVVSKAIVVATGVTARGDREVIGCAVGDRGRRLLDQLPARPAGPWPSCSSHSGC
jgi:transposase-like protein